MKEKEKTETNPCLIPFIQRITLRQDAKTAFWQKGKQKGSLRRMILVGAQSRNRTNDTGIFSPLLYRLSYLGK